MGNGLWTSYYGSAPGEMMSRCRMWAVEVVREVLAVLWGGQLAEEKGKVGGAWGSDGL